MSETFPGDHPLFDRERALRELDALVAEARQRGIAATIRVSGLAGIGKSAFLRHALESRPDFADALRGAAEPDDDASPGITLRRILSSHPSTTATDEALLAEELRAVLETTPALCIDDVQWLDEVSRRVLRAAIHHCGAHVRILLADRREEGPELGPHRTIFLAPLRPGAARKLVRAVYPAAPTCVADEIIAASSGIPFNLLFLAASAAHDHTGAVEGSEPSAAAAITRRLERCSSSAREGLRYAAYLNAHADVRHVARAMGLDIPVLASALAEVQDVAAVADLRIKFRHTSIADAIRSATTNPLSYYSRLLAALDEHDNRPEILATRLHCARGCGADAIAVACALQLGRALASAASLESAAHYFRLALDFVTRPIPLALAVDYAGVLQQLSRDEEAFAFLRREIEAAIVRGDAARAAGLLVSFYSAALTLERFAELETLCDRVSRLKAVDADTHRLILTARLSTVAFAGKIDDYDCLSAGVALRWADRRPASFVAALRGDIEGSVRAYEAYHGELSQEHARQDPSDLVLHATTTMFETGTTALDTVDSTRPDSTSIRTHPAAAGLRIFRRIADGRWNAASAMLDDIPFWDTSYEEPYGILDLRLLHSALARQKPTEHQHTLDALRRMIARRQVRHAVSPARWYSVAMTSSGADVPADITAFVGQTLDVAPMPYLFGGLPLALALLAPSFDAARCATAVTAWPRYDSRWHRAHFSLARGLLTEENTVLRQARDAFDQLRAPVFAMLAGIALPVPRARDLALAATLGQRPSTPDRLTPRESDIAELAATGARNRDIAEKLNISERTVEVHLTSAFRKLGVRSRGGLAQRLMNREASSAS